MRPMTLRYAVAALVLFTSSLPSIALADDCPAGSTMKNEEGFSWEEIDKVSRRYPQGRRRVADTRFHRRQTGAST